MNPHTTSPLRSAALALLLSACATTPPPEYRVAGEPVFRGTAAEQAAQHAERINEHLADRLYDQPPKALKTQFPDYPKELRKAWLQGRVTVRFTVDVQGEVCDVRVMASPHGDLSALAVTAIQAWRFEPARRAGQAVPVRMEQSFTFKNEP